MFHVVVAQLLEQLKLARSRRRGVNQRAGVRDSAPGRSFLSAALSSIPNRNSCESQTRLVVASGIELGIFVLEFVTNFLEIEAFLWIRIPHDQCLFGSCPPTSDFLLHVMPLSLAPRTVFCVCSWSNVPKFGVRLGFSRGALPAPRSRPVIRRIPGGPSAAAWQTTAKSWSSAVHSAWLLAPWPSRWPNFRLKR